MASVSPAPSNIPGPPENQGAATRIEALGIKLEIPLPKWAVASLAVLLIVVGVGAAVYYSVTRISNSVIMPVAQVEVYEETNFHLSEPKQFKESKEETFDDLTSVTIYYFKSDGCVQIVRWNPSTAKGDGLWMFGAHPHSVKHSHAGASSIIPSKMLPTVSRRYELASYEPNIPAREGQFHLIQGGRCLDPHPGTFSVDNDRIDQCSVKVWRSFYDGCVHFQLFNACTGTWDVYPNGAPLVHWTRCIH